MREVKQDHHIAEGIKVIYNEDNRADHLRTAMQRRDFVSCMAGEIIGLLPGSQIINIYNLFTNDLRSLIVNEAWNQVANILADLLIDAGLSFSVSRIVAELGVGAANCAFFE